jgi:hypothetical protein
LDDLGGLCSFPALGDYGGVLGNERAWLLGVERAYHDL